MSVSYKKVPISSFCIKCGREHYNVHVYEHVARSLAEGRSHRESPWKGLCDVCQSLADKERMEGFLRERLAGAVWASFSDYIESLMEKEGIEKTPETIQKILELKGTLYKTILEEFPIRRKEWVEEKNGM